MEATKKKTKQSACHDTVVFVHFSAEFNEIIFTRTGN